MQHLNALKIAVCQNKSKLNTNKFIHIQLKHITFAESMQYPRDDFIE